MLRLIFNCMLNHVPERLVDTVLISLVKDKKVIVADKNNYHPIAITSVTSKILELLILDKIGHLLDAYGHQFGSTKGHATNLEIFVMKDLIDYLMLLIPKSMGVILMPPKLLIR